ncbi:UNVERIFIED_CONTAM: hypothetical protein GTU68_034143 [Idotea baltica]|nr:hypothetical protein [Idotea baltica]
MSENNADKEGKPSGRLFKLYETWGKSGAGILISGNVMVDPKALGESRNVIIEDERYLAELKEWATSCQADGSQLWMQINHPGRQGGRMNKELVSPSDVQLPMKAIFAKPRALEESEILDLIERYGNTAAIAQKAGWAGVQIHGAHGYLVSQFLSPITNKRADKWGGSIENRARFVLEIYRNIRQKVGAQFPVGIKINSADFQRGGFTEEASLQVISMLGAEGMDLIEVSGGTYEQSAMMGNSKKVKESTQKREAYFADFIVKARKQTNVPLLLTGGFRTVEVMNTALKNDELDFVGIARPFAVYPRLGYDIFEGKLDNLSLKAIKTGIKYVDKMGALDIQWYADQMRLLGEGKKPNPNMGAWKSLFRMVKHNM